MGVSQGVSRNNLTNGPDDPLFVQVVNPAGGDQVQVTNFPAEYPLPASQVAALAPPPVQVVQATDLDIRNLSSATDSVSVSGSTVNVGNFPATQVVSATALDIRNLSSAQDSVAVTDGGGSLTVDGTVNIGNFPATQQVAGTVEIANDVGNPIPVSGSVAVNNFPATQQVAGTVAVNNFPATQVVSDGGGSLTVDGTVSVANFPATQSVNVLTQLVPAQYDQIDLSYTGTDITGVVYRNAGVVVASLTLTYTDGNLTRVQRS